MEADNPVNEANPHISNIGKMVEVSCGDFYAVVFYFLQCIFPFQEMENKMRSSLNEIYFGKTKDVVNDLR